MIKAIDGSEPNPCYGSWENFLEQKCEIRDQFEGVLYYSDGDNNYFVFPDGTLIEYHDDLWEVLVQEIKRVTSVTFLERFKFFSKQMDETLHERPE